MGRQHRVKWRAELTDRRHKARRPWARNKASVSGEKVTCWHRAQHPALQHQRATETRLQAGLATGTCKRILATMENPDHPSRRVLDLEALRLLTQPVRLRIQAQLQHGPANATTLARALGESTGLTSHHLRQLAKHGFIEEVPELGRGRERWWRSARVDWRVPPPEEQDPEMRALTDEIVRLDLATDLQEFARAQLRQDEAAGEAWIDQLP